MKVPVGQAREGDGEQIAALWTEASCGPGPGERAAPYVLADVGEEVACWTRSGAGGHVFVKGNGFLAAGYVHRSSRAGDMQIHTHVLLANATFAEGRWTRLYHPAICEHAKIASYVYEAHLRDG